MIVRINMIGRIRSHKYSIMSRELPSGCFGRGSSLFCHITLPYYFADFSFHVLIRSALLMQRKMPTDY